GARAKPDPTIERLDRVERQYELIGQISGAALDVLDTFEYMFNLAAHGNRRSENEPFGYGGWRPRNPAAVFTKGSKAGRVYLQYVLHDKELGRISDGRWLRSDEGLPTAEAPQRARKRASENG